MPSKSKAQARLMSAVAHNSEFAHKVGIPQNVGKEFNDADTNKSEMIEVESDGKQEIVEGKEPLKKDPKKKTKKVAVLPDGSGFFTGVVKSTQDRWSALKKALNHEKAFMTLEDEMGDDEEAQPQAQQQGDADQIQQELSPENEQASEQGQEQNPADESAASPLEAVSAGQKDDQQEEDQGEESQQPDPEELINALKEEGYSDQEISYIVHGQHAAEVDPTKQAKAQATQAMSDVDIENAKAMADLERQHTEQSLAAEREHKKRMSDLEYEQAQKKHSLVDQDAEHKKRMSDLEYQQASSSNPASLEQAHKQRMLDLEYEKAKKESESGDSAGDAEANKQMKMLEVEKKKLEIALRKEEMKMELEFKKREHELKLKMMEQQLKEQAKHKSEISGVKHEQKLADAKNPPKIEKKPLKKSEEDDE